MRSVYAMAHQVGERNTMASALSSPLRTVVLLLLLRPREDRGGIDVDSIQIRSEVLDRWTYSLQVPPG